MNIRLTSQDTNKTVKIIVCYIAILICLITLITLCYFILSNEIAYKEYSTSSDIRKTEVEITNIKTNNIYNSNRNNNRVIGKKYNYSVKFTIDNLEYKSNLIEKIYFSHPKKSMNIGDKTLIKVYRNKNGNYKVPKFTSLEAKDNINKNLTIPLIFVGVVTCCFILGLFMILHSKKTDGRRIPITKDNVIYAKIFVCLVAGLFIFLGILGILDNNKEYEMETKAYSDYARQVKAKILEINKQDINNVHTNGYKEKVGESYEYKVEYIVNDVKYYTTLNEVNNDFKSKKPLQIGDTKTIAVYKNNNGDYEYSKLFSYQDLLAKADRMKQAKMESANKERNEKNIMLIFLICFATFIGSMMLYGLSISAKNGQRNNYQ